MQEFKKKMVHLYGETRYSTATASREVLSPDEFRNLGKHHRTNKAFDRYLQVKTSDAKRVYETTNNLTKRKKKEKKIEIVYIKKMVSVIQQQYK